MPKCTYQVQENLNRKTNVWTYEMENFPEVTKEEEKEYILLKPVFYKKR